MADERSFIVLRAEVYYQAVTVKAEDDCEAKRKVDAGEGDEIEGSLDYSHCLDRGEWLVQTESDYDAGLPPGISSD
jgi:hypothetical protein